jgi:hypothetical protein
VSTNYILPRVKYFGSKIQCLNLRQPISAKAMAVCRKWRTITATWLGGSRSLVRGKPGLDCVVVFGS